MEGSADMLNMEVRCPACMEWTYPKLPQADNAARPEKMGQTRLDELVGAADGAGTRRNRKRKRHTQPTPQPTPSPQPAQEQWYILTTSGPRGPFGKDKITQFAKAGKIKASNRLTNARTGSEMRASEIPNLFSAPPKPVGEDEWYVQTSKGDAGPFSSAKIIEFAKTGKIKPKTMLRCGQTGQFIAANTVSGLIPTTT